jgi:chaperonin GroEL (HSP60 family)
MLGFYHVIFFYLILRYKLGHCDLIEEIMIGEDRAIKFSGLKNKGASTIVLRGANKHVLDESERSIHDALCVLKEAVNNHKIVYGGGCCEMIMAEAIEDAVGSSIGKEQLAMIGFLDLFLCFDFLNFVISFCKCTKTNSNSSCRKCWL